MADRNELVELAFADAIGTERVANGLSNPLFVTAPENDFDRLFILEKNTGEIKILNLSSGTVNTTPFLDLDVSTTSEQGLLGLAFDPDYQSNGIFYTNYTDPNGVSTIERFQVSDNPDVADASSGEVISRIPQPENNHNGGWIGFGPDGYLYYATGDGGGSNDPEDNSQDLTTPLGAILRIDVRSGADGFPADPDRNFAIPDDNPFIGETVGGEPVDEAIWSYGVRNPWRPSFDRETGDLYIADVGQNAREEINFQSADSDGGENYGWRLREGEIATPSVGGNRPADNVEPIYTYTHGQGAFQGNSVTGGYVYRGPVTELQGQYVFGDFRSGGIWSFEVDGDDIANRTDRTSQFTPDQGDIRGISSFGEDAAGNLYIVDFFDGEVFRVVGPGDPPPPPPPSPELTLTFSASSIAENGGGTTATVTRNTETTGALSVNLTSSDTTEASVPSTVTIAAGQTSASFAVNAVDDAIADGPQQVTIAASAAGFAGDSDTLAVTDNETPQLTLSIAAASISENGGGTAASVTRNTDTDNDLVVSLNSNDSGEATVPSTVTIAAGETSASFAVNTVDDTIADGPQQVTIAASAAGFAGGSDSVTVTNNEAAVLTLSISAADIAENGGGTTATVTRNTNTANDLIVSLSSSDSSEATVPSTVTIRAGQSSANFAVSAVDDNVIDGAQTVTIVASAGIFRSGSDSLQVTDNDVAGIQVSFVSEDAGYQNSIGVYDTETGQAEMLITNTDVQSNPDVAAFNALLDSENYNLENLGYFLVPDGNRQNDWSQVNLDDLLVVEDASGVYVLRDDNGTVLTGTRANAFFSETDKNPDNFNHVQNQGTQIGFEDLVGGGDQDFNDVVIDAREVLI